MHEKDASQGLSFYFVKSRFGEKLGQHQYQSPQLVHTTNEQRRKTKVTACNLSTSPLLKHGMNGQNFFTYSKYKSRTQMSLYNNEKKKEKKRVQSSSKIDQEKVICYHG